MWKIVLVVSATICCGGDDPPPSCFQAISAYYDHGCAFVDLTTGQPVPQQQATADCQSSASGLTPACEAALDDFLICLSNVTPAQQCDCTREQMDLIQC